MELALLLIPLAIALYLRPWRMVIGNSELLTPLFATLVLLPPVWALPSMHAASMQLQWSGACLVVLMLGWPLAIPALVATGIASHFWASTTWEHTLGAIVWQGTIPATLALLLGAAVRRWIGAYMFIYILGRGFLGTVLCIFVAGSISQWFGHALPSVENDLSLVARWLMAFGDGFVTGMLCAIFVAYRPMWLATWSDALYLRTPTSPAA